jgi:hypothetical protein
MTIACDNCGAEFDGRWEIDEIQTPHGEKKVCTECDDPQSTFTDI